MGQRQLAGTAHLSASAFGAGVCHSSRPCSCCRRSRLELTLNRARAAAAANRSTQMLVPRLPRPPSSPPPLLSPPSLLPPPPKSSLSFPPPSPPSSAAGPRSAAAGGVNRRGLPASRRKLAGSHDTENGVDLLGCGPDGLDKCRLQAAGRVRAPPRTLVINMSAQAALGTPMHYITERAIFKDDQSGTKAFCVAASNETTGPGWRRRRPPAMCDCQACAA